MNKIADAMLQITNENQYIIAGMSRVLDAPCIPPAARMLLEKTVAQLRDVTAKAMIADHLEPSQGVNLIRRAACEPSDDYLLKVLDAAIDTPIAKQLDVIRTNINDAKKKGHAPRIRIAMEQKDALASVRPVSGFVRSAVSRRRKAYDAFRVRYYGEAAFVPPTTVDLSANFHEEAGALFDGVDFIPDDEDGFEGDFEEEGAGA